MRARHSTQTLEGSSKVPTEREQLFLRSLTELEQCVGSEDWYVNLHVSRILRQLLVDAHPLVDQVNKKYRLKLEFWAGLPDPELQKGPDGSMWALLDGFDPDTGRPGRPTAVLTKGQFLDAKVISDGKRVYSVKDLVAFEAHVKGGVHAGVSKDDKDKELERFSDFLHFKDLRISLGQLKVAGRVVLKALAPLRSAIESGA